LSTQLSAALASIHAVKSVSVGDGEQLARTPGRQAHDTFVVDEHGPHRTSNRAGGLEGGMTTGEQLRLIAAIKPFSTVPGGLASFDLDTGAADTGLVERSDVCAVPAAAVVGEAMVCLALADALLDALGGDSLAQVQAHVAERRARAQWPRSAP
jgi:chorismate synthase